MKAKELKEWVDTLDENSTIEVFFGGWVSLDKDKIRAATVTTMGQASNAKRPAFPGPYPHDILAL